MRLVSNSRIGGVIDNQGLLGGKEVMMVIRSGMFAPGTAAFIM